VLILGALGAFAPLSIDLYLPALPDLTRDLDARASEGQLTLTACLAGLALGQLAFGPLSDRLGRRRPLLVGLAGYCVASLACAAAPSVYALTALRLVQGLAGAAGLVISRAVVRDLRTGAAAARLFSALMLVTGVAPIVAPVIGAQLLHVTSWRGLFVVLALVGGAVLVASAVGLEETLPRERRGGGGLAVTGRTFRDLVCDRLFLGYALVLGFTFGQMFAYIAGSPFVLQDIYGVSPQAYGAVFAANAVGLVALSQLNGLLVGRISPRRMLAAGLALGALSSLCLFALVIHGGVGLAGILPCLFGVVASLGLVTPNASALALAGYPHVAGSASALLGVLQFLVGAIVAPLAGVAGAESALPMAIVMVALGGGAIAALALARSAAHAPSLPLAEGLRSRGS
jgi:DHA1 family bicyclomycin/chloramphenicol resistance-like MFS transporter